MMTREDYYRRKAAGELLGDYSGMYELDEELPTLRKQLTALREAVKLIDINQCVYGSFSEESIKAIEHANSLANADTTTGDTDHAD